MNRERAAVLALSNSEQQRETLVIMLDETFDVDAAPHPRSRPRWPAPAAVVVAPSPWSDELARATRRRWPHAALVLVDPPAASADAFGAAEAASWSDPFSVPDAVARLARARPAPRLDAAALAHAVQRAERALRPLLEQAETLAALAVAASRRPSADVAHRFLAEHVANLLAQLAWTEWFDDEEHGDDVADLAAALRAAVEQRRARLEARSLELRCEVDAPAWVACSASRAAVLARCLNAVLLDLPPGPLSLRTAAAGLQLRHPALDERAERRFAAAVAARLIRQAGARLRTQPGTWTIEVEDEDGAAHA